MVKYNEKLGNKPQIVAANKMDLPGADEGLEKISKELEPKGYKIYPVSAATLEGIDELKYAAWDLLMNTEDSYETLMKNIYIMKKLLKMKLLERKMVYI